MSEEQMQREWRDEVRRRFDKLEELVSGSETRIRALEDTRTKAFGFMAGIQFVGMVATWAFTKLTQE